MQAVPVKRDDSHQSGNTSWHARCAVLALLASYLEASAHVQRQAVRKWNPVAALFGLLWEEQAQQLALSMVCASSPRQFMGLRHAHASA